MKFIRNPRRVQMRASPARAKGEDCSEARFSPARQSVFLADDTFNVVKSARAPRRLENVRNRRAMFYLDRRGDTTAAGSAKYDSSVPSNGKENFGWWLSHWKIALSPRSRYDVDHRSPSGLPTSMLSYIDSDDSSGCILAQKPPASRHWEGEKIELRMFTRDDLDVELIERKAPGETDRSPTSVTDDGCSARNESEPGAVRCSPGRQIRCQEYRIPAPFSRRSSRARRAPEVESCRARLSCSLIDSKRIGATQSRTIPELHSARARTRATSSSVIASLRHADGAFAAEARSSEDLAVERDHCVSSAETISGIGPNCDRLNANWDVRNGPDTRLYSLEDTSSVQSNDCSSDTQSKPPMCLCDELAIASNDRVADYANHRDTAAINEVASILESLQSDPEKATVLLEEEDRFCDCKSSHDQLTRLALAIETDAEEEVPAILDDPNNWLRQLRDKIERLQHGHKEIRGDIRGLHGDFQRDERKLSDVSGDTTRLRGEIRELRYLDDLLTLIQGELARISRRNWPFVLGNSEPREEVNLIV
ncbi:uncharacterized protein LOC105190884 isoform X1 [Harpegnathos saltator]|uniref:uncharacterized protein LOC105190884 isoform X1 n=2 Tax=Harpegnathos saltator TaxID=610380 RepID=UPI00058D48C0|nr:uncharacterized protein LOC105190884 isoform X1 [Harpegnathos saltator]